MMTAIIAKGKKVDFVVFEEQDDFALKKKDEN